MQTDFQLAQWGIYFAAAMYVLGNGVWINHLARRRQWMGWLLWLLAAVAVVVVASLVAHRFDADAKGLNEVDPENHWIVLTLFALLSVPGASAIIFKLDHRWTRLALLAPALIVFIPTGRQLADPADSHLMQGLLAAIAVCIFLYLWQMLLDEEPASKADTATEDAA